MMPLSGICAIRYCIENASAHSRQGRPQFTLADLRAIKHVLFGSQHWQGHFVVSKQPSKSLDQSITSSWNSVCYGMVKKCRSHAMLMHRIHFIEVHDTSAGSIVEPAPFAVATLERDQT